RPRRSWSIPGSVARRDRRGWPSIPDARSTRSRWRWTRLASSTFFGRRSVCLTADMEVEIVTLNLDRQRSASLQDIDLLGRLSHYFDTLDEHVRAGHGWFIFNAAGGRGARLVSLILSRLAEAPSLVTYYF